jgi:hypothetical protein
VTRSNGQSFIAAERKRDNFSKMSEPEIQQLLHGDPLANVQERAGGKTALYSVGFIFGFKLRQTLRKVDAPEMEAYISHLQNVSAARECDGGRLVELIARLHEMYLLKEMKKTSRQLAQMPQERFETVTSHQPASSGIRLRIGNESCLGEDDCLTFEPN